MEERMVHEDFNWDGLIAGDAPDLVTDKGILVAGNNLLRGTLLGKIAPDAGAAVAGEGNTGDGTVSNIVLGAAPKIGDYILICKTHQTNAGVFRVIDPDGQALPDATVAVPYSGAQIAFHINDGEADFVAPTVGAAVAGEDNVGNGTVSGIALGTAPKIGDYVLTCKKVAANGGLFGVVDPEGKAMADASVGVAYAEAQLHFTINDGSADFAEGDVFTISVAGDMFTIPVTGGGLTKSLSAATDGSQNPYAVLAEDVNATSADVADVLIYTGGCLNSNKMTFGTAHTANSTKGALRSKGIILKTPVSA
jgi:hypothetical protein